MEIRNNITFGLACLGRAEILASKFLSFVDAASQRFRENNQPRGVAMNSIIICHSCVVRKEKIRVENLVGLSCR
jgi:hypothetical protein